MLKNSGAKYVILGHSENRLEGDTNQDRTTMMFLRIGDT